MLEVLCCRNLICLAVWWVLTGHGIAGRTLGFEVFGGFELGLGAQQGHNISSLRGYPLLLRGFISEIPSGFAYVHLLGHTFQKSE